MSRPEGVIEFISTGAIERSLEYKAPISETDWKILITIAKCPRQSPKFIADMIGVGADITSRSIKKLSSHGYIFEQKRADDRRFTSLGLTIPGLEALCDLVSMRMGRKRDAFVLDGIWTWDGRSEPVKVGSLADN